MKKQDWKAGESLWQNSILQLTRSKSKTQKETEIGIEKDGFKQDARLGWKIVEAL